LPNNLLVAKYLLVAGVFLAAPNLKCMLKLSTLFCSCTILEHLKLPHGGNGSEK